MHLFRRKPPYTKRIAITPPKADPNRHGIAIATHLKNEEDYIAEWVLFHRSVGVRHFVIYDNGSSDKTVPILRSLLTEDCLTVIPWIFFLKDVRNDQILNSQVVAFAHAILNFGSVFQWMAFIDVDEFLLPKTGRMVEDALVETNGFPNVSLPWHMFGRGGHRTKPDGPILRHYVSRAADPISRLKNASNFKCVVDPCQVSEVSVHHFQTALHGDLTSNDSGKIASLKQRKSSDFYSASNLQLNHYYTKSDEELQYKLKRGPASPASRERYTKRVLTAVDSIESNAIEDMSMVAFLDRHKIELSTERPCCV